MEGSKNRGVLLFLIGAFGVLYLYSPIRQYVNFELQNFDYGVFFQATALFSRIEPPLLANLGRHVWADSQNYLLPIWSLLHLFPSPHYVLIIVHGFFLFTAGLVWLRFFRGSVLGICGAILIWSSPHMVNMAHDLLHGEVVVPVLLLSMYFAARQERSRLYLLFAVLASFCGEDVAIAVAILSLCLIRSEKVAISRSVLSLTAFVSLFVFIVDWQFAGAHFRGLSCSWLGYDIPSSELPVTAPWVKRFFRELFNLSYYQDVLFKWKVVNYSLLLLWPLLPTIRRQGILLVPVLFALFINIFQDSDYYLRTFYHYDYLTFPLLLIALAETVEDLELSERVGYGIAVVALAINLLGPQEMAVRVSDLFSRSFWDIARAPEVSSLEELNRRLPDGIVISADDHSLNYLLESRDAVFMFGNPYFPRLFGLFGICEDFFEEPEVDIIILANSYPLTSAQEDFLNREFLAVEKGGWGAVGKFKVYVNPLSNSFDKITTALSSAVGEGMGH